MRIFGKDGQQPTLLLATTEMEMPSTSPKNLDNGLFLTKKEASKPNSREIAKFPYYRLK